MMLSVTDALAVARTRYVRRRRNCRRTLLKLFDIPVRRALWTDFIRLSFRSCDPARIIRNASCAVPPSGTTRLKLVRCSVLFVLPKEFLLRTRIATVHLPFVVL
uniref:Uncharacterized protein n=1 Tax=Trichuris muris TaxID=70415 RepID=A0A5S6R345_TRIMR